MPLVCRFLVSEGLLAGREVSAPAGPGAAELDEFCAYLAGERGLAGSTVAGWRELVRGLVEEVAGAAGRGGWASFGADAANGYVGRVARARGLAAGSVSVLVSAVRALARWAFVTGRCPAPAHEAVLGGPPRGSLVRALPAGDVEALSAAADTATARGRRDRAIVLMAGRLGLRAGEIAGLRLDDIDWRAAALTVRGKGGRELVLPLPQDVGEALAGWLVDGRPQWAADRAVFTRVVAPVAGLGRAGIGCAVRALARRAGIEEPVGPHRLRHSVACQVLAQGGTLAEAAELLGHASVKSTAVYARVDVEALRKLAPPWGKARRR
jgi:site-specific recombinase XerD